MESEAAGFGESEEKRGQYQQGGAAGEYKKSAGKETVVLIRVVVVGFRRSGTEEYHLAFYTV